MNSDVFLDKMIDKFLEDMEKECKEKLNSN